MDEAKKEIIKTIISMSGKYSPGIIFADWVECCAIAIQNGCCMFHDSLWQKRENQYMAVIKKYEPEEQKQFSKMFILLGAAFQKGITDLLGEIYMESGCGSKATGQFFTPFHVSVLTAKMGLQQNVSEHEKLIIDEPSVGGGGMVIAMAKVLKDRGINYQRCMEVVAQDLDWRSVYMAYVQFSLLGISAEVVQGNTLTEPYVQGQYPAECVFKTPMRMGVLP